MKKTYYHAVTMDKMISIMKHGLVLNISDSGIYFTDDAISSLDWIKTREELWFKRKLKSLCLIIFEVNQDDISLVECKDYRNNTDVNYPELMREAQKSQCVIYKKSIHPSLLKFEECVIDGNEYDCYVKTNNQEYVVPSKSLKINIFVNGLLNALGYDYQNRKYINPMRDLYKKCKSNRIFAEQFYDYSVLQSRLS